MKRTKLFYKLMAVLLATALICAQGVFMPTDLYLLRGAMANETPAWTLSSEITVNGNPLMNGGLLKNGDCITVETTAVANTISDSFTQEELLNKTFSFSLPNDFTWNPQLVGYTEIGSPALDTPEDPSDNQGDTEDEQSQNLDEENNLEITSPDENPGGLDDGDNDNDTDEDEIADEDVGGNEITDEDTGENEITGEDTGENEITGEDTNEDEITDEDTSEDEITDEDTSEDEITGEDTSEDEITDEDTSEDEITGEDTSEDEITDSVETAVIESEMFPLGVVSYNMVESLSEPGQDGYTNYTVYFTDTAKQSDYEITQFSFQLSLDFNKLDETNNIILPIILPDGEIVTYLFEQNIAPMMMALMATSVEVSTLDQLRTELQKTGEKTVIIKSNIAINSGYIIEVPSGAKITLITGGQPYTITASGGNFTYGAIQVKSGAEFTIDDTITFTNPNGYFFDVRGTLTMNSGTFTGGKGEDGGAIFVGNGGRFTLNGGNLSNNTGTYGGAVHVSSGGLFTMNGGEISNNTTTTGGDGGAIHVKGEFIMNGGTISYNNSKTQGGGIYIDSSGKISIYAGDFIGNTASTYGGAIGTGNSPQSAGNLVYNAVIVGNSANKNESKGGGMWSCPQGTVSFEEGSTVIAGNSASKLGDQLCIESSKKPNIPTKMLNGTNYEWYWNKSSANGPAFTNGGAIPSGYSDIMISNTNQVSNNLAGLKAEFPTGKVFMYGNTAACGGGVGGNGNVNFKLDGTPAPAPSYTSLTVSKAVTGTGADTTKEFSYTVTFTGNSLGSITSNNAGFTTANGGAKWTGKLKHGDSVKFDNVTVGTSYIVLETQEENYTESVVGGKSGTLNSAATVAFTNTYTAPKTTLTVRKSVAGTGADTTKNFNFTISFSGDSLNLITSNSTGFTKTNGGAKWTGTLKHGDSVIFDNVTVGTTYTVSEAAETNYAESTVGDKTGTLNSAATVTFTNTYTAPKTTLTVNKSVTGIGADTLKDFNFTVTFSGNLLNLITSNNAGFTKTNNGAIWTGKLKHGDSVTFDNVTVGTSYIVHETPEVNYDESVIGEKSGTLNSAATVAFTNTYTTTPKINLTISKSVVGTGADTTADFDFTVTFNGNSLNSITPNSNSGFTTANNGEKWTGTLKHGDSVTFDNVAAGTTYTVVEKETTNYTESTVGNKSGTLNTVSSVVFLNTYTAPKTTLTISKSVAGTGADTTKDFNYTVTFTGNLLYLITSDNTGFTKANGGAVWTGTLKDGDSVTFDNVTIGTSYIVNETPEENYTESVVGGKSGTLSSAATVAFTNTYTAPKTALTVRKSVAGTDADTAKYFDFTITFTGNSLDSITSNNASFTKTNGGAVWTGTLKHGESVKFDNVTAGTAYTVSEASETNYVESTVGEKTGTLNSEAMVTFTNTYTTSKTTLMVSKSVTGTGADTSKDFDFEVRFFGNSLDLITPDNAGFTTITNGATWTGTLRDGESVTFNNVMVGTNYSIDEATTANYTASTNEERTGTLNSTGTAVAFTNTYDPKTTLTVSKNVDGTGADTTKNFEFTVTFTGDRLDLITSNNGRLTTNNGGAVWTGTLKDGDNVTFNNVDIGTVYTVNEATEVNYTASTVGEKSGTLNSAATVAFINTYADTPNPEANLTISKSVAGTGADTSRNFNFSVTFAGDSLNLITSNNAGFTADNGGAIWTGTLKHGDSVMFDNVKVGTTYTINETSVTNYTESTIGEKSGTLNSEAAVVFINTYKAPKTPSTGSRSGTGTSVNTTSGSDTAETSVGDDETTTDETTTIPDETTTTDEDNTANEDNEGANNEGESGDNDSGSDNEIGVILEGEEPGVTEEETLITNRRRAALIWEPMTWVPDNYTPMEVPNVYMLLDDEGVPLGYFSPVLRDGGDPSNPEDYDWIEVDMDGIPLGVAEFNKEKANPKTGDGILPYVTMAGLLGLMVLIGFTIRKVQLARRVSR